MKPKDLIAHLKDCPEDYDICLSACVEFGKENDYYNIIFDNPICGLALDDKNKEIRLVCQHIDTEDHPLGKVTEIK